MLEKISDFSITVFLNLTLDQIKKFESEQIQAFKFVNASGSFSCPELQSKRLFKQDFYVIVKFFVVMGTFKRQIYHKFNF